MNSTVKITGIVLATLVIGILLGGAGWGALMNGQKESYDQIPPSEYFLSHIDEIIKPDSSQKKAVDEIAQRTADRIAVLFDQHRMEMAMLLDSMKEVLEPILHSDQQKRLANAIKFGREEQEGKQNLGSAISFSYEYAEHLQQELELDSMQTEQIMAIIHASHYSFRRNLALAEDDPEKVEKAEHQLFDETSHKIQNVLTNDQKELFRKKQKSIQQYSEEELSEEE